MQGPEMETEIHFDRELDARGLIARYRSCVPRNRSMT